MRCYQCGYDNPEASLICKGCRVALPDAGALATSPLELAGFAQFQLQLSGMEQALGYATMGERFLAFLCDASVETVLIWTFIAFYDSKSSLHSSLLRDWVVLFIPLSYMTLAEFFFHGTVGKHLLHIQLRADALEPRYPSFFKILLRESVGKFVSGIVLGIGYLAGGWHPKHKTWADRMAGTVVVRIGVASTRMKAVLGVVLVCAYVWLGNALTNRHSSYRKSLPEDHLIATESEIDELHEQIFEVFSASKPSRAKQYQLALADLPSKLDEYDHLIAEEQDIISKYRNLVRSEYEAMRLAAYDKIIPLRLEIAALVRRHLQFVLAFDRQKQKWGQVLQARRQTMRDINSRNDRINEIAGAYLFKRITFMNWVELSPGTPGQSD